MKEPASFCAPVASLITQTYAGIIHKSGTQNLSMIEWITCHKVNYISQGQLGLLGWGYFKPSFGAGSKMGAQTSNSILPQCSSQQLAKCARVSAAIIHCIAIKRPGL